VTLKEYLQKQREAQDKRLKEGKINIRACAGRNYYCNRGFLNKLLDEKDGLSNE